VHKQGHGNTPHDHGPCWVVYGAYSGVTEITKYKRTDDGAQPGVAKLEKDRLDRLTAGVVVPYLRGDIHSTNAVQGPGVVFRFLSYDLDKIDRSRTTSKTGKLFQCRPGKQSAARNSERDGGRDLTGGPICPIYSGKI
jgi:hypothetical protein